jgi:N-terminal acetyltransferase B complex non-catalytic subunit
VLKALALLRLGKEDECIQLLDAVRAEVPCDDSTLQAMTICYREIHNRMRAGFLNGHGFMCIM